MAATSTSPALETYNGNCHCGAIRFTFAHPALLPTSGPDSSSGPGSGESVVECNCSICTRNGYLLIYPERTSVRFTQGEEGMAGYRFGNKGAEHYFCPTCGTSIGGVRDGSKFWSLNARTLQGVDLDALTIEKFDGRNRLGPEYKI